MNNLSSSQKIIIAFLIAAPVVSFAQFQRLVIPPVFVGGVLGKILQNQSLKPLQPSLENSRLSGPLAQPEEASLIKIKIRIYCRLPDREECRKTAQDLKDKLGDNFEVRAFHVNPREARFRYGFRDPDLGNLTITNSGGSYYIKETKDPKLRGFVSMQTSEASYYINVISPKDSYQRFFEKNRASLMVEFVERIKSWDKKSVKEKTAELLPEILENLERIQQAAAKKVPVFGFDLGASTEVGDRDKPTDIRLLNPAGFIGDNLLLIDKKYKAIKEKFNSGQLSNQELYNTVGAIKDDIKRIRVWVDDARNRIIDGREYISKEDRELLREYEFLLYDIMKELRRN